MSRPNAGTGKKLIGLAVLFATFLIAPAAASAATQWVALTGSVGGNASCASPGFIGVPGAQDAMNAASSGDTVRLCPGTWNTAETTTGGGFVISDKTLTIEGSGETETIIDGSGRTLPAITFGSSDAADSLTVKGLTIQNATAEAPSAIASGLSLTIEDVRIRNNAGPSGAVGVFSLVRSQTLTIRRSTLTGVPADAEYVPLALVYSNSSVTVEDSTLADSHGLGTGGIVSFEEGDYNEVTVDSSTFTNLSTEGCASSLLFFTLGETNGVTITNSTFSGNSTTGAGCDFSPSSHIFSAGSLTMNSSTFAGNTGASAPVEVANGEPTAGDLVGLGGLALGNNVILGDPEAPTTCLVGGEAPSTNGGGNVISDGTNGCAEFVGGASPSLQAKVPSSSIALDPLALNAPGTTETMALGAASVARGAAISAECPAIDQRGVARPAGQCDSGAYQTEAPGPDPGPDPGPMPSGKPKLRLSIKTPKKARAGKGFEVRVTTKNVAKNAPARATRVNGGSSPTTAKSVKTCARLPKGLFVVKRDGGKVKGRKICWTRSSLAAGKSAKYKITLRSSKSRSGSVKVTGTASATNDSGATVKASGSDRTRIVKPRTPNPKPPTG